MKIEKGTKSFILVTLALSVASFAIFVNLYSVQPLLPLFKDYFQISAVSANYIFAISSFVLGATLLIIAPLSDILGRRLLMRIALLGTSLTAFAMFFIDSFLWLIILRGLQAVFLAGIPAIAIAYMRDEFSSKAFVPAVGMLIAANSLGGISGRLLGGFIAQYYNWHMVFLIGSSIAVMATVFFWLTLPKSRNFVAGSDKVNLNFLLHNIVQHLKTPTLLLIYFMGGLNFFVFVNQYTFIGFRLVAEPYNWSLDMTGSLFLTYLTGTLIAGFSGRIANKFKLSKIMLAGIFIMILGTSFTLSSNIYALVLGLLINALGFFLAHSIATAWISKNAKTAPATASALYLVFYYVGASLGGFYLGIFWRTYAWSGVVFASYAIFLISIFLVLRAEKYE